MAYNICPLLTLDPKEPEPCIEHQCAFYTQLQGKHPQTNEDLNEWGCAIAWMPILMIENAQQMRQTDATLQSFRNNMTKQGHEFIKLAKTANEQRKLESDE